MLSELLHATGSLLSMVGDHPTRDIEIDDVVLMGLGDVLPEAPTSLVLCTAGPPTNDGPTRVAALAVRAAHGLADLHGTMPILTVDPAVSWHHVLQLLLAVVGRASEHSDLFALADSLAVATGGAVAVEDAHRRVLAYSAVPGQAIDELRRQGILGRQVPPSAGLEERYRSLSAARRPVSMGSEQAESHERLALAVHAGEEVIGTLWIVDDGQLTPDASQTLMEFAPLFALQLLRSRWSRDGDRRSRGNALGQLVDGAGVGALERLRPLVGSQMTAVALSAIRANELSQAMMGDLVHLRAAAAFGDGVSTAQRGDRTYLLLPGSVDRSRVKMIMTDLSARAKASLGLALSCAVGRTVDTLATVQHSLDDVEVLLPLLAPGQVAMVEDFVPRVALARVDELMCSDMTDLLPPVRAMLHADAATGSAYTDTVLAFFESGGDITAAAQKVMVHNNTFRYRLRRAEKVFGLDMLDPDMRLVTWLQLRSRRAAT